MPPIFLVRIGIALGLAGLAWALHRAGDFGSPIATYLAIRILALAALIALVVWQPPNNEPWWRNGRVRAAILFTVAVISIRPLLAVIGNIHDPVALRLLGATMLRVTVLVAIGMLIRRLWRRPGPWWPDSRLRIVVLLALIELALGGVDQIDAAARSRGFDRAFQAHLRETPELRPALNDYPLRKTLYQESRKSFARGGWTAASDTVRSVVRSQIAVYADDRHILDYWRAYLAVERRLQSTPQACAAYAQDPSALYDYPQAAGEIALLRVAVTAMNRDGADRLLRTPPPSWFDPSKAEWDKAWQESLQGPDRVSADETKAILEVGDPAADCRAALKWIANTLSRDPAKAAAAFRIIMVMGRAEGRDNAYHSSWVAGVDVAGSGFACPPIGTRFLLDIDNMDGRQVTQTVLGQRGIECRLHSNAWGTYGLIGGMIVNEAGKLTAQTVARLWPLQVGRTITAEEPLRTGKGLIREIYTVSGVGWYQIGARRVLGYQIDMANDVEATGQRYILHFVWSPELRWNIRAAHGMGQRALSGA